MDGVVGRRHRTRGRGDLPAWGYYLRHVQGVTFDNCTSSLGATDARQKIVGDDVTGLVGSP